ncbi:hypothetical protein D8674_025930 [Pyrus ussuriensis x Pyrus communis]|uniref:5'-3' exonuclease domain-containing protein n=1 Tax=Pyrus ussuriensis x Pyrus communis TaxID=2448454 RepID=A0A5N5I5I2_9ROSA|nr:hypothetical protein D8674_025930 [Pyrus ussuriensis x Pyrus communis]
MVEVAVPTRVHIRPLLSVSPHLPIRRNIVSTNTKACKIRGVAASSSSSSSSSSSTSTCGYKQPVDDGQIVLPNKASKKRVFFLDVNPLCYAGSSPSLHAFAHWVSLFLNQVSLSDPVIAVVDGEGGSEHRRQLLPSYKAHRWKFTRQFSRGHVGRSHGVITNVLRKCNVPVIEVEGHEADDVIATLVGQVIQTGYWVVIASPDKDFKELLLEDVQLVMPLDELERWSFYTLRCIVGDHADGVPGIQHLAPGFGEKTALKLLKKHGSLENLLNTAAVRTAGRQYAQDVLTKHADYLRNHEILSLRRDVDVKLTEEWLVTRDTSNDSATLSNFYKFLEETGNFSRQRASVSNG